MLTKKRHIAQRPTLSFNGYGGVPCVRYLMQSVCYMADRLNKKHTQDNENTSPKQSYAKFPPMCALYLIVCRRRHVAVHAATLHNAIATETAQSPRSVRCNVYSTITTAPNYTRREITHRDAHRDVGAGCHVHMHDAQVSERIIRWNHVSRC